VEDTLCEEEREEKLPFDVSLIRGRSGGKRGLHDPAENVQKKTARDFY